MWELSNAPKSARRPSRTSIPERPRAAPVYRYRRAMAQLTSLEGGLHERRFEMGARLLLNDLNQKQFFVFTEKPLQPGQRLTVALTDPQSFFATCEVVACSLVPTSGKIISDRRYDYRVRLRFVCQNISERMDVARFCDIVQALLRRPTG